MPLAPTRHAACAYPYLAGPAPALRSLVQLELLNLSYNRLPDVSDIEPLRRLKVLYLRSNRVSSLSTLASLPALHSLDLECNALASLEALQPLWGMPQLTELRLRGNLIPEPAYRRTCRAQLPSLRRLDGLLVAPAGRSAAATGRPRMTASGSERALALPEVAQAERAVQAAFLAEVAASAGQRLAQAGAAGRSPSAHSAAVGWSPFAARPDPRSAETALGATGGGACSAARRPLSCEGDASSPAPPRTPPALQTAAAPSLATPSAEPPVTPPVAPPLASPSPSAPWLPATFVQAAANAAAEAGTAAADWGVQTAVIRAEVTRLETELTESQARRHRELGACARSAAVRVEEMAEAVERAERRIASLTAQNEEMLADRAAVQVRGGWEMWREWMMRRGVAVRCRWVGGGVQRDPRCRWVKAEVRVRVGGVGFCQG